jgi:hypothetical protein
VSGGDSRRTQSELRTSTRHVAPWPVGEGRGSCLPPPALPLSELSRAASLAFAIRRPKGTRPKRPQRASTGRTAALVRDLPVAHDLRCELERPEPCSGRTKYSPVKVYWCSIARWSLPPPPDPPRRPVIASSCCRCANCTDVSRSTSHRAIVRLVVTPKSQPRAVNPTQAGATRTLAMVSLRPVG